MGLVDLSVSVVPPVAVFVCLIGKAGELALRCGLFRRSFLRVRVGNRVQDLSRDILVTLFTRMDIERVLAHAFCRETAAREQFAGVDLAEDCRVERVDIGVMPTGRVQLAQIEVHAEDHRIEDLADRDREIGREKRIGQGVVQTDDIDVRLRVEVTDRVDDDRIVLTELVETGQGRFGDGLQRKLDAVCRDDRVGESFDEFVGVAILLKQFFDSPGFVVRTCGRIHDRVQSDDDRKLDVIGTEVQGDEVRLLDLFDDTGTQFDRSGDRLAVGHGIRKGFRESSVIVVVSDVEDLTDFRSPPAAVRFVVIVFQAVVDADALRDEVRIGAKDALSFCGPFPLPGHRILLIEGVVGRKTGSGRDTVTKEGVGSIGFLLSGKGGEAEDAHRHDHCQEGC